MFYAHGERQIDVASLHEMECRGTGMEAASSFQKVPRLFGTGHATESPLRAEKACCHIEGYYAKEAVYG